MLAAFGEKEEVFFLPPREKRFYLCFSLLWLSVGYSGTIDSFPKILSVVGNNKFLGSSVIYFFPVVLTSYSNPLLHKTILRY